MWILTVAGILCLGLIQWLWDYLDIKRVQKQLSSRERVVYDDFGNHFFFPSATRVAIANQIHGLLAEETSVDISLLSADDDLAALRVFASDSGDADMFVIKIQKTFGITFEDDELERLRSLRDIVLLVEQCLDREDGYSNP